MHRVSLSTVAPAQAGAGWEVSALSQPDPRLRGGDD
jgi:hypothetical protein